MKKENSALIVAALALALCVALGVAILNGGQEGPQGQQGYSGITNYDSLTLGDDLVVNGTTTLSQSVDGIIVGGAFSLTATDTPLTVYTHTGSPAMCDSELAYIRIQSNGFAPAFAYSLSKNVAGAADLIASTTVATTTSANTEYTEALFRYAPGDTIVFLFNDDDHTNASSTHRGNVSLETGMWCQTLSI